MDIHTPEPMAMAKLSSASLAHNLSEIRKAIGEKVRIMGVIKANAYGHGMLAAAAVLQAKGVTDFGVANIHEAITLRKSGILAPETTILAFAAPLPSQIGHYIGYGIDLTLCDHQTLEAARMAVAGSGGTLGLQVKVDTGMGRLGLPPRQSLQLLRALEGEPGITLKGIYTHFAESSAQGSFTARQAETFREMADEYRRAGGRAVVLHAANSGAILSCREAHLDMVRPGIMLYGYHPLPNPSRRLDLRPVMQLEAKVIFIKEVAEGTAISYSRTWKAPSARRIATIAAGYADGYHRTLSGKGTITIRGKAFRQVGTITMDQIMVDLGDDREVRIGDSAVLFGQEGTDLDTLAGEAGTISYELLTAVSPRVRRQWS